MQTALHTSPPAPSPAQQPAIKPRFWPVGWWKLMECRIGIIPLPVYVILLAPHYSAAKAGVLGPARAMARELGSHNIRVNSITPGLIQTDIADDKLTPEVRIDIIKGIPLGLGSSHQFPLRLIEHVMPYALSLR